MDWDALQAEFNKAYLEKEISVKDWIEQQGYHYNTAKVHVKLYKAKAYKNNIIKKQQSVFSETLEEEAKKHGVKAAKDFIENRKKTLYFADNLIFILILESKVLKDRAEAYIQAYTKAKQGEELTVRDRQIIENYELDIKKIEALANAKRILTADIQAWIIPPKELGLTRNINDGIKEFLEAMEGNSGEVWGEDE